MMCNYCSRKTRIAKRAAKEKPIALGDTTTIVFVGDNRAVHYGPVSGARYIAKPGDEIQADNADLPYLLSTGKFEEVS